MNKPKILFITLLIILITLILFRKYIIKLFFVPLPSDTPTGIQSSKPETSNETTKNNNDIETIADNLVIPWEIGFLPDNEILITERSGNLLKIGKDKKTIKIEGILHKGEGGLLGLALDPNFKENHLLYLYSTTKENGDIKNRVEKYKLEGNNLVNRKEIVSGIKGSSNHDGGRIKFGPDGYLYITTGDAENSNLAQDKNSLNGKILRVDTDGNKAPDNPFNNLVYTYGHRNPQGLTWDDKGNLWATEHGPSGPQTGNDEINLIKKGLNYGWPEIKGSNTKEGMITPVLESGKTDTWAPSGIIYYMGNLFFAGLRGEALYQGEIIGDNKIELKANFKKEFGRLRTITLGPDGYFYVLTNNTDGRGTPKQGDDRIIRIKPNIFFK